MMVLEMAIKSCLFLIAGAILLKAAAHDLATRTVPNIYPYGLLLIALAHHWLLRADVFPYLAGLLIAVPFLAAFYMGKLGGADAKMVIALSLFLGLEGGLLAIMAALLLAAIREAARKKGENESPGYAFVPYLLFGYAIAAVPAMINAAFKLKG
ncbi:MAG: prepilin peptidase [Lachnospiraceae bacterium]|nr:prepilin peptidase [Lachnospiraceae bacterium]